MTTGILPNMVPLRDITQISKGDRLFYELGHKIRVNVAKYEDNWVREGRFKEIHDVDVFVSSNKSLLTVGYLEHHNFMIIKTQ